MSSRAILYFTFFLAAMAAAAIFMRPYLFPEEQVVEEPKAAAAKVLVATREINVGSFMTPEDVAWREWTGADAPVLSQHFIKGAAEPKDVVGAVVREHLVPDQPILAQQIVKPGQRGFLAAVLRQGMRAISVPIDAVSSNSGLVFPGDMVDLILTLEIDDESRGIGRRLASETILRNVRVIAIGQRVEHFASLDAPAEAKVEETATLELLPEQAERVTVASRLGQLALSLRSLVTLAERDTIPVVASDQKTLWASDVSKALDIGIEERQPKRRAGGGPPPKKLMLMRGDKAEEVSIR